MKKEITVEHCDEWLKNKNINPITKKKISENGNIYKNLYNKCDFESKIKNFCVKIREELTDEDHKYYMKVKHFCDDIFKPSIKKIKKSLSPLPLPLPSSNKKNKKKEKSLSLQLSSDNSSIIDLVEKDRYKKYTKITEYFRKIKLGNKGCIEPAIKENTYTLNNGDIGLYKQIGTPSVFGVVYKSININKKYISNHIPKFVSKIQLVSNAFKSELKILKIIMKISEKDNIPCIPYIYNIMECNNIIKDKKYPKPIQKATNKNKSYSLILYELASGDLNSFLKKERDYKIWKNCFEQIFMSLFVFHSIIGNNHGDAHSGNFLYRKIKEGGCFCYNINGINYYIENLGYAWMIWDYSNAVPLNKLSDPTWIDDYMNISRFMRKRDLKIEQSKFYRQYIDIYQEEKYNRFGYLSDSIKITKEVNKLQENLAEHIYYKCYKNDKITTNHYFLKNAGNKGEEITEYQWFKMMLDKNLLFSKTPIGEVISTTVFTNPNKFYNSDR